MKTQPPFYVFFGSQFLTIVISFALVPGIHQQTPIEKLFCLLAGHGLIVSHFKYHPGTLPHTQAFNFEILLHFLSFDFFFLLTDLVIFLLIRTGPIRPLSFCLNVKPTSFLCFLFPFLLLHLLFIIKLL